MKSQKALSLLTNALTKRAMLQDSSPDRANPLHDLMHLPPNAPLRPHQPPPTRLIAPRACLLLPRQPADNAIVTLAPPPRCPTPPATRYSCWMGCGCLSNGRHGRRPTPPTLRGLRSCCCCCLLQWLLALQAPSWCAWRTRPLLCHALVPHRLV